MTCPRCKNQARNVAHSFCTQDCEPHLDVECSACGLRFYHPIDLKEKPDETQQNPQPV